MKSVSLNFVMRLTYNFLLLFYGIQFVDSKFLTNVV